MKKLITCLILSVSFLFSGIACGNILHARAENETIKMPEISARSGLLIDYDTGTVIYEKNSKERLPVASMTKLALLAVVFNAIEKGNLKLSDEVVVSGTSAAVGGSSAFLDAGSRYEVGELIKTVVVASANDSSVALAEHLAGSEDVFVSKMNKFVDSLGLEDTHFVNATGLPVENHYSSAYDMAMIYKSVCNNETYKKFSKIWMDDFIHPTGRKTELVNTNRLVRTYDGIEGGKTGYTDKARFCLTASAKRGGTRLIGVVIGANDSKTRFAEMTKLFNFGFANFESKRIVNSEIPITISSAKNSKEKFEVFAEHDSVRFLSKTDSENFTTDYQLNKVKAPLKVGDTVGKLFVFDKNNMVVDEINLVTHEKVKAEVFSDALKKIVNAW